MKIKIAGEYLDLTITKDAFLFKDSDGEFQINRKYIDSVIIPKLSYFSFVVKLSILLLLIYFSLFQVKNLFFLLLAIAYVIAIYLEYSRFIILLTDGNYLVAYFNPIEYLTELNEQLKKFNYGSKWNSYLSFKIRKWRKILDI